MEKMNPNMHAVYENSTKNDLWYKSFFFFIDILAFYMCVKLTKLMIKRQ